MGCLLSFFPRSRLGGLVQTAAPGKELYKKEVTMYLKGGFAVVSAALLWLWATPALAQEQECYNCCNGYSTVVYQGNRPIGGQLTCEGWCWAVNEAGELDVVPCVKVHAKDVHGEVYVWCGCPDETGKIEPPDECHTVGVKGDKPRYRTICEGLCPDGQVCKKVKISVQRQPGGMHTDVETCVCVEAD